MPEERNRILTDHLSSLLFVPTSTGIHNLEREGITDGVELAGDVMFDAFLQTPRELEPARGLLDNLGVGAKYVLATLHRAETTSTAHELTSRIDFIIETSGDRPVILPLHPRTRAAAERFGVDFGPIRLVDPVDYRVFGGLLAGCSLVLTDSGGVQKEAYFHRVPCVTLRRETEWPETVEAGWNRLWKSPVWNEPRREISDYGTGDAAQRIVDSIGRHLGAQQ
jgi:UDP-GlcNAc3NAcA epimerase